MNNLTLVSIIIPCRNEEKFIGKCLDSIVANDYPKDKLEVLVSDGMSEDRTREIVKSYSEKYPFISLIELPASVWRIRLRRGVPLITVPSKRNSAPLSLASSESSS